MRKKRFLAVVLAASMTMANVVAAAAAATPTPTVTAGSEPMGQAVNVRGNGSIEGIVNENVFNVVVPTTVSKNSVFDFIMDPQKLIKETKAAKYASGNNAMVDGVVISVNSQNGYSDSSLYFVNLGSHSASSNNRNLSDTSDPYKLINKSTMDVDISVNAVLTPPTGVTVSTDKTFAGNKTEPSMYMAVKKGSAEKAISTGNASGYLLTAKMPDAKSFYKKVSENGTYVYKIPSVNADGSAESSNNYTTQTYEFQLTGTCNTDADWSAVNASGTSNVQVTYYLNPHVDRSVAPSIATTTYTVQQGRAVEVDVNLGAGNLAATDITEITYTNSSGAATTLTTDKYSFADGKLTFTADYIDNLYNSLTAAGRVYKVKFNDTAQTTIDVTLRR